MNNTLRDVAIKEITITRAVSLRSVVTADHVATEEPLEIGMSWTEQGQLITRNISVTMRTPGNDAALAAGFLFTEGIIKDAASVKAIAASGTDPNKITVHLHEGVTPHLQQTERNFYTTSSCGVCGKASIDAIKTVSVFKQQQPTATITAEVLYRLPNLLRQQQPTFEQTGGLHATAYFSTGGTLELLQEDVGRHNALDKLVGMALTKGILPLSAGVLLLSGRASFELIQKATMAGIGIVAAVGAPSSLAVQLAQEAGITLVGFLRSNGCNIYTHPQRILFSGEK